MTSGAGIIKTFGFVILTRLIKLVRLSLSGTFTMAN